LVCLPLFLISLTLLSWASSTAQENKGYIACIVCHEFMGGEVGKPVKEWMGSTHQSMGITCAYCHGGDETLKVSGLEKLSPQGIRALARKAMYSQEGFVAKPDPVQMLAMCGQCHEDAVNRYRESIMGQAFLEKRGGPSCTRCHGAHRNIMPEVPKVCSDCHKDVVGFDRIDAMNVTSSTIDQLYGIRLAEASRKIKGPGEKIFPEELESFEIGFVTWGMVLFLTIVAIVLYRKMEK